MTDPTPVAGSCPQGCGSTLTLAGNHVRCSEPTCPDPWFVDRLLSQVETEHVVTFGEVPNATVIHPLRERLGDVSACDLHDYIRGMPAMKPGHYRAVRVVDRWEFEPLG